ncbi:hypothetical protein AAEO56_09190 [Flavobacterium sp. DGU11]|uniref:Uncharacterized protein n=1 Tax=Flavobacterium arundinis TaxID=3139143 RepID=A0ABU9HXJ0_9FLAO
MKEQAKRTLELSRGHLATLSNELISDLNELVAGSWGITDPDEEEEVASVDIEIFAQGYALAAYPMDDYDSQLGYKPLLTNLPGGPLGDSEFCLDGDIYDFDNEEDMKEMNEFDKAQNDLFFEWFLECWKQVDTSDLETPMTISFHDSFRSYDLVNQKWTK